MLHYRMLTSLGIIFISGLTFAFFVQRIKLPRIIGMLAAGIIAGPFVLNLFDAKILEISGDLRKLALIIILLKAGLSLDIKDLKKNGRPAFLMSFIPAAAEILACRLFAPKLLGLTPQESLLLGSVLGAVSPAVVVPRMVNLIENKRGTKKGIPQLILAGASCDDVFVIVMFSTFTAIVGGGSFQATDFLKIPLSIITGIISGSIAGIFLFYFFEFFHHHNLTIKNSVKTVIILSVSFFLISLENSLQNRIPLSGLLATMAVVCAYRIKADSKITVRLSQKFGKLWIPFELILFVLVGAATDINYTIGAGAGAVGMIFISLAFRITAVFLCLVRTKFNVKERLFCGLSYIPKATVQAAIGAVPLSMGFSCGQIILSTAVLSIIITAPLGATAIDWTYKKLLTEDKE